MVLDLNNYQWSGSLIETGADFKNQTPFLQNKF